MENLIERINEDNRSTILDTLMEQAFANGLNNEYIEFKGTRLPKYHLDFADAIENFKIRDDDIFVCSFPKAGTTWTQEMVWCISNDLDFEGAKVDMIKRFPFLELSTLTDAENDALLAGTEINELPKDSVETCEAMPSPRFIKTHLPFHLLPRELRDGKTRAKIIYVQRNPKDICISYYHHSKIMEGYDGDFELFCELFLTDKVCCAPFWGHILGFWNQRNNPDQRILYLKYEEMKADLPSVIHRTTDFLGKPSLSIAQVEQLMNHLSFSRMRDNPSVNKQDWVTILLKYNLSKTDGKFMRCGQVDQWKKDMTLEMIKRFDEWTAKHLGSSDLVV